MTIIRDWAELALKGYLSQEIRLRQSYKGFGVQSLRTRR